MEIKTCEQYVIQELEDAKLDITRYQVENGALKEALKEYKEYKKFTDYILKYICFDDNSESISFDGLQVWPFQPTYNELKEFIETHKKEN